MVLKLFNRAQSNVAETKASSAPIMAFHGTGRAVWSARDSVALTRTGFIGNPVGFRCVKMIAEAVAAIPFMVKEEGDVFDGHPLLDLIKQPNCNQSRQIFLETLISQFILSGDAYVEAVLDEHMLPMELYVLRSDRVSVVPGQDGWPVAYEYKVGVKKVRYPIIDGQSKILHLKQYHPLDDHYGLSALQAAAAALDIHNSACKWSKSLLDNAARPSGAIVYSGVDGHGTLGRDQYSRLVDEIEYNHQGASNAGRPMLLEGGLDWKPMGFSPNDMEFQKTKDSAARDIALSFGVPPMLLGLPGDNTYTNYVEANRAFFRQTVLPLAEKCASSLATWLSGFTEIRSEFVLDLENVTALSAERDAKWKRVAEADFLTDQEKRQILGLASLPDET